MGNSPNSTAHRLAGLVADVRQTWRLMRDPGVPAWAKAIPFMSLAYLIWPLDLLADPVLGLGQLDDLAVIVLAMKAFVAVCALPQVRSNVGSAPPESPAAEDTDVVDAEFRVLESHRD